MFLYEFSVSDALPDMIPDPYDSFILQLTRTCVLPVLLFPVMINYSVNKNNSPDLFT